MAYSERTGGSIGRRVLWPAVVVLAGALVLAGCANTGSDDGGDDATGTTSAGESTADADADTEGTGTADGATTSPGSGGAAGFPAGAAIDYQLGGGYPPAAGVTVVVRDSTDAPAKGLYSVCYVNAFQTQPGAEWADVLVLHDASGAEVFDPGWPDERILDISTADNRWAIADELAPVIAGCAADGFDAVEFDNLDSYTRSRGAFDLEAGVQFATLLVQLAHDDGLAAGQKNTPELEGRGRTEIGFDFAVAEECRRFDECASYTDVYGDQVLAVEYADDLGGTLAEVCADPQLPVSAVVRDRDLTPAGDPDHVEERC